MKTNKSKTALIVSQIIEKVQLILGILILGFFGLGTIGGLTDEELGSDTAFLVTMIIFDLIGVLLIVLSRLRHKLIKNFKKYVSMLSNDPTGSIANLAAALGTSEANVNSNLEKMIKKKYFSNAYIDKAQNRIVLPNHVAAPAAQPAETVHTSANAAPSASVNAGASEMTTVICKGCGGVNTVPKGGVAECEYCGSGIQG